MRRTATAPPPTSDAAWAPAPAAYLDAAVPREQLRARLVAALDHPNIIKVLDAGEVEGRPYMVMEFIEGPGLNSVLIGRSAMLDGRRVKLIRQAAEAALFDVAPRQIALSNHGVSLCTLSNVTPGRWIPLDAAVSETMDQLLRSTSYVQASVDGAPPATLRRAGDAQGARGGSRPAPRRHRRSCCRCSHRRSAPDCGA